MTAVVDMYPETFRRGYRRELLILGMSIVSFLIGLIMCTEVRPSCSVYTSLKFKVKDSQFVNYEHFSVVSTFYNHLFTEQ